jgi:Macrocin-O-methyltransferase (TylF)
MYYFVNLSSYGAGRGKGAFGISREDFSANLKKRSAWDDNIIQVQQGWFNETCPIAPINKIAFLRLDGDLFQSTWDVLVSLYDRVIPGGYIYVDDYGSYQGCRDAIEIFRHDKQIYETTNFIREDDEVGHITFEAVWWQKRLQ